MENHQTSNSDEPIRLTEKERREFLKRAGKFAIKAPATALLLKASIQKASPYGPPIGPSDRRLKADIVREDTLPNGLAVYSFRYKWNAQRFMGVMADEVEQVMPAAVSVHPSGYKMVDYSMVLG